MRLPLLQLRSGLLIFLATLCSGCVVKQAFDSRAVHLQGKCKDPSYDPTMANDLYQRWVQAGFEDFQIKQWRCIGVSDPTTASDWRSVGFTWVEAKQWRKADIEPEAAKELVSDGYNPETVGNLSDGLAWARSGFSESDALLYAANHFTLKDALGWRANGFTSQEAITWRKRGATETDAAKWKKVGIAPDQINNAEALNKKGYTIERSVYYAKNGVGPQGVKAFDEEMKSQEAYRRLVQDECHGSLHSESELLISNPYQTAGICYQVVAFVVQWLGPDRALMNMDFSGTSSGLMLVEFSETPSTKMFQMLIFGEGATSYTSTSGSLMTVPKVRMLNVAVTESVH